MIHQDWETVKWDKRGVQNSNESKKDFMKRELQAGRVISQLKISEKSASLRKIESEEERFKHKTLSLSIAKRISQKRMEMKLSQKDLAMKLSLPESIIKEYEKINGNVIPNPNILNKIEKIIGRVRD
jgi:ribosome-binding protein aMBF1 (putative translation factor)